MATSVWSLFFVCRSCFRYFSQTRLLSTILDKVTLHAATPMGVVAKQNVPPNQMAEKRDVLPKGLTEKHSVSTNGTAAPLVGEMIVKPKEKLIHEMEDSLKNIIAEDVQHQCIVSCKNSLPEKSSPSVFISTCFTRKANDTLVKCPEVNEFTVGQLEHFSPDYNKNTKMLFKVLKNLDIFTVTSKYREKDERTDEDYGVYCKNLFLKDRRGQFYLVICEEELQVDLKLLKRQLNAHRNFSFGSSEDLKSLLKLSPGAVSPFAVVWEEARDVRVIISKSLVEEKYLNFHPLDSYYTTKISFENLNKFLSFCRHDPEIINI